jgi:hypothetical protein
MYILRCEFFDLDRPTPSDHVFVSCLVWLKNNQETFVATCVGVPILFYGFQVGHVLSACFKEKKVVATVNNQICKIDLAYMSIYFVIQTTGPHIHGCEMYVDDYRVSGHAKEPSMREHLYDNQYEYLLNREIGE